MAHDQQTGADSSANKTYFDSELFSQISIAQPGDKVFKDECVCSFDTPESEDGLFICMKNFEGVGSEFLKYHHNRRGWKVYLNHRRLKYRVTKPESLESKPKRLAIGVEGGFDPDAEKEYRYEDDYSIVTMPERRRLVNLPKPDLPELVLQSVDSILKAQSCDSRPNETSVWEGEERKVSKHADNLEQLPNPPKVPPSGWKCEKCDKTDNLWLNLTDGSILCGRKFYDGSGGNNHAVEHYEKVKYPLAVKLGTITAETADIYSYPEEEMVLDPHLAKHLAHFGIDIQDMTKTEKSILELEIDMNEKIGEWSLIQEEGKKLEPIGGPGFTGLVNLGNSCYMNSVLQVLFSIDEFQNRYSPAQDIYEACDSIEQFNYQMAKLGYGLLSGKYSTLIREGDQVLEQKGIEPKSFKNFVCGLDRNFATKRQQDAHEFFLFLVDLIQRNSQREVPADAIVNPDPSKCFEVVIEDRIQCLTSNKVKYTQRAESCLSLDVDLLLTTNQHEVDAYHDAILNQIEPEPILVRPIISLNSLIDDFVNAEIVENFYSSAISSHTMAEKCQKIAKFPRVLVLQIKKFQCGDDWIPKKLDISLEVPDIIDLDRLKATGLQAGEEKLPESNEPTGSGQTHPSEPEPTAEAIAMLASMGIDVSQAIPALKMCNNDPQRAIELIFDPDSVIPQAGSSAQQNNQPPSGPVVLEPHVPDNQPKTYKLKAFISHMGPSTLSGHYVCHIRKDDRWYIFNDNKVAISENLPKQFGYLYFYERQA